MLLYKNRISGDYPLVGFRSTVMPTLSDSYAHALNIREINDLNAEKENLCDCLYDAIWELSRRGVIRPAGNIGGRGK